MNGPLVWVGIAFCLMQSAIFSGLNLAFFGVARLRLEVAAATGNRDAARVLQLRRDSNLLLTTILWGNVGINVLLTLLSNSVLAGLSAFLFSTILITFVGEIFPQAYFSRNALRLASALSPVLRVYKVLLYPVAKPSAWVLDRWLGPEGIQYWRERDIAAMLLRHVEADEAEIDHVEGQGALNFLEIDDLSVSTEGELVEPRSIITIEAEGHRPVFPAFNRSADDPFLKRLQAAGRKWIILTNADGEPLAVLDADGFLRDALLETGPLEPLDYCHKPVVVLDGQTPLGKVLWRWSVEPEHDTDDVIDRDIILVWDGEPRIITGADILGRLLHGIVQRNEP